MGAGLVVKTAEGLSKGTLAGKPQDIPDGKIIPAPKITRETCIINWEDTAEHIDRLIRGLSPYPGAISEISDGNKKIMMKIFEAQAESEDPEPGMAPGCITTDGKTLFRVKCGKGSIKITCLQAAGKRRMAVKDFLSGFRNMGNFSFSKTII
jgi:methionyl-tRNA formyltransferase